MALFRRQIAASLTTALLPLLLIGCANPGPPRAPSLFLPLPVPSAKITADRIGNEVDVHFTVPARSTDNLPLRSPQLTGSLCRQLETGACITVTGKISVPAKGANSLPNQVTWRDTLPTDLLTGQPRAIGYRVEFFNATGVSGGKSELAVAPAGAAPTVVTGLTAEGSRSGIVLRWKPEPASAGEIIIRREDTAAAAKAHPDRNHPEPGITWLSADTAANRVLDATALPKVAYRYTAQRRVKLQIGGRELEMRSAESAPINFTLREIYAPSAPSALTAVGFTTANSSFAVDLIWQPVNESAVMGYNIYRQRIDASGAPLSQRARINSEKTTLPGFHDTSAEPTARYRYEVTSIDANGNESIAASTMLEPAPR